MPYPDRFYPVVDSVAWVARLAALGVGTVQLRAKDLNDSEALQLISDALAVIKGTPTKLVVNDYWRAAVVAGAKHLHLGQEDLVGADLAAIRDAGRIAYEAGLMEARDFASPSTPVVGTPFWHAVS